MKLLMGITAIVLLIGFAKALVSMVLRKKLESLEKKDATLQDKEVAIQTKIDIKTEQLSNIKKEQELKTDEEKVNFWRNQ